MKNYSCFLNYSILSFPKQIWLFFFLLCLGTTPVLIAQKSPILEWGEVSDDERNLTIVPYDSTASAVVLCHYGYIESAPSQDTKIEKHIRIKILDEKAFDYANVEIPYYSKEGIEHIDVIKAQTINFDDTATPTIEQISRKDFFREKVNDRFSMIKFSLPAVRKGSIIEWKYTTISKIKTQLDSWTFQQDLPTLYSKLAVRLDGAYDYRIVYQGKRLREKYRDISTKSWFLDSLPALKAENYVHNYHNYAEKVHFQMAGYYTYQNLGKGIGEKNYHELISTWKNLANEALNHYAFAPYAKRRKTAKAWVQQEALAIDQLVDTPAKIKYAYDYMVRNFSWNEKLRFFPDLNPTELAKVKKGNSAELNLFLVNILREMGLDAYPLAISTKTSGLIIKTYPIVSQFNHIIVVVKTPSQNYFLDATNPNRPWNLLAWYDVVKEGFLIDKNKYEWLSISQNTKSKRHTFCQIDLSDLDNPTCKVQMAYIGYEAQEARLQFDKNDQTFVRQLLPDIFEDIDLESLSLEHKTNPDEALKVSFTIKDDVLRDKTADVVYLPVALFKFYEENPFNNKTRLLPVEFTYPINYQYTANIVLPKGYRLDAYPETVALRLPEKFGKFRLVISENGSQFQINCILNLSDQPIPMEYYGALQTLFNEMLKAMQEQIVLEKE